MDAMSETLNFDEYTTSTWALTFYKDRLYPNKGDVNRFDPFGDSNSVMKPNKGEKWLSRDKVFAFGNR
jgi:hypothetical protein